MNENDNNYIYLIVGKNLKKIRKAKNLTQKELAEKCNLSDGFISDLESKTFRTISLNTLFMISKKLNISIKEFFND